MSDNISATYNFFYKSEKLNNETGYRYFLVITFSLLWV